MLFSSRLLAAIDIDIDVTGQPTSTGTASALFLNRAQLLFQNDNGSISINQNDSLAARVQINYVGNGLLRGTWKVDGFPFHVEQRVLSFGSDIVLHSDNKVIFPTFQLGRHKVEFVAEAIAPDGSVRNILTVSGTYFIKEGVDLEQNGFRLTGPFEGAAVNLNKAVFSWTHLTGAQTYKLHMREKSVLNQSTSSRPMALTRKNSFDFSRRQANQFKYQQNYEWAVEAFDLKGNSMGLTKPFEFLNLTPIKRVSINDLTITPLQVGNNISGTHQSMRISSELKNTGSDLKNLIVETSINGDLYDQRAIQRLDERRSFSHELNWMPLQSGDNAIQILVKSDNKVIRETSQLVHVADNGDDFLATFHAGTVRGNDFIANNIAGGARANDFIATLKAGAFRGNDFQATAKPNAIQGNDFLATVKADRSVGDDYLAIPVAVSQSETNAVSLDFIGRARTTVIDDFIDFIDQVANLGLSNAEGIDFTVPYANLNDANGINFTFPYSSLPNADGINFTIPKPGNNDISGVDFIAIPQGNNDVYGVDFIASLQGNNDVSGVDFTATPQGDNDVSGVDFIATPQGNNDVSGVDFTATPQGNNDVSGVDFIATPQGNNDVSGVDFIATPQGKNDVSGVDFTATPQGNNDVSGVDFTAMPQGNNDVSGVDFTATPQSNNDVSGVDFTATPQGINDVSGVDFIATPQGNNDVSGVNFTAKPQGNNDVSGVDFIATPQGNNDVPGVDFIATPQGNIDVSSVDFSATPQGNNDVSGVDFTAQPQGNNDVSGVNFTAIPQGRNDVSGVDFIAIKPLVVNVPTLRSQGQGFRPIIIDVPELRSEGEQR